VTDETEQKARLARLKQAQRRQSAHGAAVKRMLEASADRIEDKVATVKTMQKTDGPRVLSAINSLLRQDDETK